MEDSNLDHLFPAGTAGMDPETILQFSRLFRLIDTLRGEEGCPWDRKQTPRSMSSYLIEEVYELVEAISSGSADDVCEELGDVLFHIFFIACMFKERGDFDIQNVADKIVQKMVRRHPHVFGDKTADTVEEIKERWQRIKQAEKKSHPDASLLASVPSGLPALMRAYRISSRAAGAGFDWDNVAGVMKKVEEEWAEFNTAVEKGDQEEQSMEFGDILFTLVNVARFNGFHPETALSDSVKKFEDRFRHMEKQLSARGKKLEKVSRGELEQLWDEAKIACGESSGREKAR